VPVVALALVAVFGWGNGSGAEKASAANPGTNWSINIRGTNCSTAGTPAVDQKCNLSAGQNFVVEVRLDSLATGQTDYSGFDILLTFNGVTYVANSASTAKWPDSANYAEFIQAGSVLMGDAIGFSQPNSTHTGAVAVASFNCAAAGAINLVHGASDTNVSGNIDKDAGTDSQETLTINCPTPTNTPTITPTFTPTNTPTNTPTSTPPPVPRWLKLQRYPYTDATSQCDPADASNPQALCNQPQDPAKDDLGNLWLTRQGAKIPPLNCLQSSDNAVFSEALQFTPQVPDPKGVHPFAYIGGFEFEVRFDPKLICVNLVPGEAATALGLVCFVDDKDEGQVLQGIARMGCLTKGKNKEFPPEFKTGGPELAQVWVKPQPELYSQVRPNQDNGVMVQLLDQDCALTDEQGHPIPLFSCEDAAVTIRYLEGDVEPDCRVDATDQQNVAFRWGAGIGSLLYNQRFDNEPSGTVKGDGDIDIADLQFVFGRHGSRCGRTIDHDLAPVLKPLPTDTGGPHPRQEPRNPTA
jgi:hypothetical protein